MEDASTSRPVAPTSWGREQGSLMHSQHLPGQCLVCSCNSEILTEMLAPTRPPCRAFARQAGAPWITGRAPGQKSKGSLVHGLNKMSHIQQTKAHASDGGPCQGTWPRMSGADLISPAQPAQSQQRTLGGGLTFQFSLLTFLSPLAQHCAKRAFLASGQK